MAGVRRLDGIDSIILVAIARVRVCQQAAGTAAFSLLWISTARRPDALRLVYRSGFGSSRLHVGWRPAEAALPVVNSCDCKIRVGLERVAKPRSNARGTFK